MKCNERTFLTGIFVFTIILLLGSTGFVKAEIIPEGTEFRAETVTALKWSDLNKGSSFTLKLFGDPIKVRKQILVPAGSLFRGRVSDRKANKTGNLTLILRINKVEFPNGRRFPFLASLAMSPRGNQHSNTELKRITSRKGVPLSHLTVANKKNEYIIISRQGGNIIMPPGAVFIMNVGKDVNISPDIGQVVNPKIAASGKIKTIRFINGKIMKAEILDFSRNTLKFMVRHEGNKKEYSIEKISMINFADNRTEIPNDLKKLNRNKHTFILRNGEVIHGHIMDLSERTMIFDIKSAGKKRRVPMNNIARIYFQ